jgi:hypothetical protein
VVLVDQAAVVCIIRQQDQVMILQLVQLMEPHKEITEEPAVLNLNQEEAVVVLVVWVVQDLLVHPQQVVLVVMV